MPEQQHGESATQGSLTQGPLTQGPLTLDRVPALLRRGRRTADLSQRELAERLGVSKAWVGDVEAGRREPSLGRLLDAFDILGLQVLTCDPGGAPVLPMAGDAVRDRGGRCIPAHLDTVLLADGEWPAHFGAGPRRGHVGTNVWVPHRARRDARRRQLVGGATPQSASPPGDSEHVTRHDVERHRELAKEVVRSRRGRAQQIDAPRSSAATQTWEMTTREECTCPVDCYETRGCTADCPCRCGG